MIIDSLLTFAYFMVQLRHPLRREQAAHASIPELTLPDEPLTFTCKGCLQLRGAVPGSPACICLERSARVYTQP